MYTIIGLFGHMRNVMKKEFKRVGIVETRDKYGYLNEVLGHVPYLSKMTISEMEQVILSLRKLPECHFGHLSTKKEEVEKEPFSVWLTEQQEKLGWSRQIFEAMTGISKYRFSRIKNGTSKPTEQEITRYKDIVQKYGKDV